MTLFLPDTTLFPLNAIDVIAARMEMLWVTNPPSDNPDVVIVKRRIMTQDPSQTIGVFPMTWEADETSYEMGKGRLLGGYDASLSNQATLNRYLIGIQSMVSDSVEETGIATHATITNAIRSLLATDGPLAVGLDTLSHVQGSIVERIQRRRIDRTRYLDNLISGKYVYLATTQYIIETETK